MVNDFFLRTSYYQEYLRKFFKLFKNVDKNSEKNTTINEEISKILFVSFLHIKKVKKTSRKTKMGVIKNQQPRHVLGGKNGQQRE